MNKILVIARKDAWDAFHSKTTYFYVIFLFLIAFPYFDGFRNVLKNLTTQGVSPAELQTAIQAFLNSTARTLPLVLAMLFCSFLSGYAIIMDKAKRTLESLMATPLSLKQIWLGKSMAVALPSIATTLLVLLVAILAMNVVAIVPATGAFVLPTALSWITGVVIIPIMTFLVVLIVSLLQLVMSNPRIANFAYIVIFLGIYMSTITELTASWDLSLVYLVVTVILVAVTFFLARFLTKERIILSSKG